MNRAQDTIEAIWANWAENLMGRDLSERSARVTALRWGSAGIIGLPGEIFAETALQMRQRLTTVGPLFLLSYADDNPGYIPPCGEYAKGGYEIDEAHRFYGMGATIAPGVAEHLAETGCKAAEMAGILAANNQSTKIYATEGSKS